MSESESDSSLRDKKKSDRPKYPVDGIYESEKDKADMLAMPEIQREALLADRQALKDQHNQKLHLRQLLEARKNGGDRKRKAVDLEESPRNRKSSRQKTTLGGRRVGETSAAIDEYKRQREEKGIRDKQRRLDAADRRNRRARSSSDNRYSSADADGESEVEWDDGKPRVDAEQIRKEPKADYTDVRRTTLPRNVFAEYCFYPGFVDAVKDCFVRIPIAGEMRNGQMAYRMVLIKGNEWRFCEVCDSDMAQISSRKKEPTTLWRRGMARDSLQTSMPCLSSMVLPKSFISTAFRTRLSRRYVICNVSMEIMTFIG